MNRVVTLLFSFRQQPQSELRVSDETKKTKIE